MRREKPQRYIGAHINQDLYEHIKAEAERQDRPMRYVLEQMIRQSMNKETAA
jgi:hypothetical protein